MRSVFFLAAFLISACSPAESVDLSGSDKVNLSELEAMMGSMQDRIDELELELEAAPKAQTLSELECVSNRTYIATGLDDPPLSVQVLFCDNGCEPIEWWWYAGDIALTGEYCDIADTLTITIIN